jgi:hypothetical protein
MHKITKIITFLFAVAFFAGVGVFIVGAATSVDVSRNVNTVTLKDSDGDGLLDRDDPHPNVAEIYIVVDENKNGIVDGFEK